MVAKEIVGNSLLLYSVSRNKESLGDVAVGRWKVEGEGRPRPFMASSAEKHYPYVSAHHLPVWQFVLFINPHSKRSLLFLCSFLCCHPPVLLPVSLQSFYLCYIKHSRKLPRNKHLRPIFKKRSYLNVIF